MKRAALVRKTREAADLFPLGTGLEDYAVLKERVGKVFVEGRRRVETELVRMRYHTGLLINEHLRLNNGRAEYGTKAVLKLEKDSGVDFSELQRYAKFAHVYPIVGGRPPLAFNLPWQSYRKLMVISGDDQRQQMTREAEKNEWPFEKIEARVAFLVGKERGEAGPLPCLPKVSLGSLNTYRVIAVPNLHSGEEELLLDLGFSRRQEMDLFGQVKFAADTIVTSVKEKNGSYSLRPQKDASRGTSPESLLYTYKAYVERVIDGDTLKLDVRQGFGQRFSDKFRLKGIDCPELDSSDELSKTRRALLGAKGDKCTPSATKKADPSLNIRTLQGGEGQAAKRFVESELAKAEYVMIKSTVSGNKEKYGRYLVDVFYQKPGPLPQNVGGRGESLATNPWIYLNQLLLDKGHAVRVRN